MTDQVARQAKALKKALRARQTTLKDMEALATTLRPDLRKVLEAAIGFAHVTPDQLTSQSGGRSKHGSTANGASKQTNSLDLDSLQAKIVHAGSMEEARDTLHKAGANKNQLLELARRIGLKGVSNRKKDLLIEDLARHATRNVDVNTMMRSPV